MSSSTSYVYREDVFEGDSYKDVDVYESYTEREYLGRVMLDGEEVDLDVSRTVSTNICFAIYKDTVKKEKGLVSGWANVAKNADGSIPLDWQGDIIDPDTLEDAAIDFMKNYQESGVCHEGSATGMVVESIVLTKDKQAAMGIPEGTVPEGWFITVQLFDDEVIEKVKNGEYTMFSIQGTGQRVAV